MIRPKDHNSVEHRALVLPGLCLILLLILPLPGCRGEPDSGDPGLNLDLAISPTPPAVGPARLIITLEARDGTPVEGALITVEGNMSHAGMVPVLDTATAEGPGRYGIQDFTFTMAGDWVLTAHAVLPDGRWVRREKATDVVSVPGGGH